MANLMGIGLLQYNIVSLISAGKKETIKEIEKHFDAGDTIEYLYGKYKDLFITEFDGKTYDNVALNKYFSDYAGWIVGEECRKYGIRNADEGLLLMLSLISNRVEMACPKWEI